MGEPLLRFQKPLDGDHLVGVLEGASWPTEKVPGQPPVDALRDAVASLPDSLESTAIDLVLVEPVHRALKSLSPRAASDMRVWHYLAVTEFPDLVWRRWTNEIPQPGMLKERMTTEMTKHFLGQSSLAGVSRNTFARLWWTAHHLSDGDDYELARTALSNRDMFQAIFERFFGIYPPAARACLSRFKGRSEGERRQAARWLQQCLSTTILEALTQEDIESILDEALPGSQ